jgi:hypothetical protein
VFNTERIISTYIYVLGHMCFDMSKILKAEHVRLARCVKFIFVWYVSIFVARINLNKIRKIYKKFMKNYIMIKNDFVVDLNI